jgi:hypothetical protein
MKVIIIEDEAPARQIVKTYLASHADIELLGRIRRWF